MRRTPLERTPAAFEDADANLAGVLEELDDTKRYSAWIMEMIAPHVSGRILEVGAGRGTYSTFLAERGHLTALEPSPANSEVLRERLKDNPNAVVVTAELDGTAAPGSYDTVVLLNVLEHISDDHRALADIYESLAPGGKMVLWVPAFEALYGKFDQRIGHYRRYRRDALQALVHKTGFQHGSRKNRGATAIDVAVRVRATKAAMDVPPTRRATTTAPAMPARCSTSTAAARPNADEPNSL